MCHLKVLDPASFPPEPLPSALCSARDSNMLRSLPKYIKLLSVNEDLTEELAARLDSCHVRSNKTFSIMHVAIFDFTSVTIAMVTGKEYGLDSRCTFIQTVFQMQM